MKKSEIRNCLNEFFENKKNQANNTFYLETALFIEDIFDITLSDDEISKDILEDSDKTFDIIERKMIIE